MSPTLLTLPVEVRLMIFEYLFHSTTVRVGFEQTDTMSNHTSILSTCRLIHREAAPLLTKNILLHFRTTPAMLDLLGTLPSSLLSQLRRVRVKVFPVPLNDFKRSHHPRYFLYEVLPTLAGLKLDLLVVEDGYHEPGMEHGLGGDATHEEIEGLINVDGWKELHFLSSVPDSLFSGEDYHPSLRHLFWDMLLKSYDGEDSGAGAKTYVAKQPDGVKEATAGLPEMRAGGLDDTVPFNSKEHGAEVRRELLVIANRGSTVDYTQQGFRPMRGFRATMKRARGNMTWQQMKERRVHLDPYRGPRRVNRTDGPIREELAPVSWDAGAENRR